MDEDEEDEPRRRVAAADEAEEEGEGENEKGRRRRRQAKMGRNPDDVPRVRDETGERVREKFEEFLESCVDCVGPTRSELTR